MKNYCIFFLLLICGCQSNDPQKTVTATVQETGGNTGEQLFKNNCYQCHRPGAETLGPNLAGARNRWPEKNELYEFVRNPQEMIGKNKYARDLQQQYKGSQMLPYPNLTREEIDAILDYCDQAGNK